MNTTKRTMIWKRGLCAALTLLMLLLSACGAKSDAPATTAAPVTTEAPVSTTAPETVQPTEAPSTEPVKTEPPATEASTTEPQPTEPTEFVPSPNWPTGSCGDDLTWYFNPYGGELTITGSGDMYDYDENWRYEKGSTPWYSRIRRIKSVRLLDGVTSIGDYAFSDCSNLTSVTIPDSVTRIGERAFLSCEALKRISIPAGVTSIGDSAFAWRGMEAIEVASDNPNYSSVDGVLFDKAQTELLFYPEGKKDSAYAIPEGVTRLPQNAVSSPYLKELTFPSSLTDVAWEDMNVETLNVAPGNPRYSSIEGVVFDAAQTTLIYYPSGRETKLYEIPDGVTEIGEKAFYHGSLTGVKIPDSVTTIGSGAFYWSDLKDVTIGSGVTRIGAEAFIGRSLREVTIPENVREIGAHAFGYDKTYGRDGYEKINSFVIHGTPGTAAEDYAEQNGFTFEEALTPELCGKDLTWRFDAQSGLLTIEGSGDMKDYLNTTVDAYGAPGWAEYRGKIKAVSLPDGLTGIGDNAFRGCYALTSVKIPDSVTYVGNGAFCECSALEDVTIGTGVTVILDKAFAKCTFLKSVTLPDSVTDVGTGCFQGCRALTQATLSKNLKQIPDWSFQDCTALERVTIQDGVTEIGKEAFWACTALKELQFPDGLKRIGDSAFANCKLIKSVKLPSGVEQIGEQAFGYLDNGTRKRTGFTVYGTPGTAAERYAKQNSFTFVAE